MSLKTPLEMMYHWEDTTPQKVYLKQPINGAVISYTWAQAADKVRRVAAGLIALNLPAGSHVAVLSKNCAEWFIADLAIMLAGHISVPIYSTAGEKTIQYVLNHAACPVIFVGKLDDTAEQVAAIPEGVTKLAFPYPDIEADKDWDSLMANEPYLERPVPEMDGTMTIIYTSGSTGNPKGVVHTYNSISWAASNSRNELSVGDEDRILSYLPLAHITERVLVEMASFYANTQIGFIESLDTFNRDICHLRPTLFISVPRLWTRFQMGVLANMPQKKLDFLLKIPFVGNIGRAYEGVDIRIGEEGEIQVKGPCNMQEYYLEPEKTAETFTEDGYLRTGDKGAIDSDGYIKITGRLKEIFKTAKGKYIAPVPIEAVIMGNSSVEQVCVTGSQLKQPIALVVLSEDAAKQDKDKVEKSLLATLESVNAGLESHAVLDRLVIMKDDWTVENGLLTPTLKIKRHLLEEKYDGLINAPEREKLIYQK